MKIAYKEFNFRTKSLVLIEHANKVIETYKAMGHEMTLRQVYYQLVKENIIENSERSYKNLGELINNGRLAGLIDWFAIIDRTRNLAGLRNDEDPTDAIEKAARIYRLDHWRNQPKRVEVWVEKDALKGVIGKICNSVDVDYFSCRGYTSQSEMWRAARRLMAWEEDGKETVILHLGDHDPSGIDMSRDIEERLSMFGANVDFQRIALNMHQIEELSPPPNPAKLSDSRAQDYIKRYGSSSWELDALDPDYLESLITTHVEAHRDEKLLKKILKEEKKGKTLLNQTSDRWGELIEYMEDSKDD